MIVSDGGSLIVNSFSGKAETTLGFFDNSTGNITVSGAGSRITLTGTTGNLVVGNEGAGTLTVTNGGAVNVSGDASFLSIGFQTGATGNVTVSGAGSTLTLTGSTASLFVGLDGTGTLTRITQMTL